MLSSCLWKQLGLLVVHVAPRSSSTDQSLCMWAMVVLLYAAALQAGQAIQSC